MKEVDITLEGELVGKAWIQNQGLYLYISCRCRLPRDTIYRLVVQADRPYTLGVPVPEGREFRLETRVPAKHLPADILSVTAELKERFVPLSEEEPFPYLSRLKQGRFSEKYGKKGIIFC